MNSYLSAGVFVCAIVAAYQAFRVGLLFGGSYGRRGHAGDPFKQLKSDLLNHIPTHMIKFVKWGLLAFVGFIALMIGVNLIIYNLDPEYRDIQLTEPEKPFSELDQAGKMAYLEALTWKGDYLLDLEAEGLIRQKFHNPETVVLDHENFIARAHISDPNKGELVVVGTCTAANKLGTKSLHGYEVFITANDSTVYIDLVNTWKE